MPRQNAFSLVELSIVLVILGLLVGGIITGQSLIRAAELRSVTSDFQNYQTAIYTFRDKYFALPGDMTNATDFWGADPDGCPTHTNRIAKTETCNGDGNGEMGSTGGNNENYRLWQQLANAGLIEGSYTGVAASGGSEHIVPGENAPNLKLSGGGVALRYIGSLDTGYYYPGDYGNAYTFGAPLATDIPAAYLFTAEEAWNIDTKIDDGRVGTGKLTGPRTSSNCRTDTDPAVAEYRLSADEIACVLIIKSGF